MTYLIQIDDEVREATSEEAQKIEEMRLADQQAQVDLDAKIAARESALAKLAELGLTEEEIAAL